jgi:hypothetical protein
MKLWKLLLLALVVIFIAYGSVAYLLVKVAKEVDSNGGLKSVVERIWEGNKHE